MDATTANDMYESKYIQLCTPELALQVGINLRWEDRREVEEMTGLTGEAAVLESHYRSALSVYFTVPNGKAAGVAGVTPDNRIWATAADTKRRRTLTTMHS